MSVIVYILRLLSFIKAIILFLAQICTNDIGNNVIIPIAVGCALIGLIIIVLIAYMIGRKRVKHRYEAM